MYPPLMTNCYLMQMKHLANHSANRAKDCFVKYDYQNSCRVFQKKKEKEKKNTKNVKCMFEIASDNRKHYLTINSTF